MHLLTTNNAKCEKGGARGYTTGVLHLAPGRIARRQNVCPEATGGADGCLRNCIFYTGKGRFPTVKAARIRRTRLMFDRPELFEAQLIADVAELVEKAPGRTAIRPNGTSDVDWCSMFPQFVRMAHDMGCRLYDYTKRPELFKRYPSWYDLTFSYSGRNEAQCRALLDKGHRVAVVFSSKPPRRFWGHKVVNGDHDDLRFLNPSPCVVALTPKGTLRTRPGGLSFDEVAA